MIERSFDIFMYYIISIDGCADGCGCGVEGLRR